LAKVDLRPQEAFNNSPYDLGVIHDIEGRMFKILDTDPLVIIIKHKLDKIPIACYPVMKFGPSDFWVSDVDSNTITINRDSATILHLLIY